MFLLRKNPGKRRVRDRRRHLLNVRENQSGASDKATGKGWGRREKNCLPENLSSASCRWTRHFDCSISCQSSSVWSHAEKKQISETNNIGAERELDFLKSKDRNVVLKPEQRQAVSSLQKGEDVVAVLPTCFGKSIIFTGLRKSELQRGRAG